MNTYDTLTEKLIDLVISEHCQGCCEDHCDINASMDAGYALWAVESFYSCGAASEQFDAVMAEVKAKFGKQFDNDAEASRAAFCAQAKVLVCDACNAHTFITDHNAMYYASEGATCGNCLAELPKFSE